MTTTSDEILALLQDPSLEQLKDDATRPRESNYCRQLRAAVKWGFKSLRRTPGR